MKILIAHEFIVPADGPDLHGKLFNTLKNANINEFSPNSKDSKKVIFHCEQNFLFCQTAQKPTSNIPTRLKTLSVNTNSAIKGWVTLSNYRSCGRTPQESQAYLDKHGQLPKGSASKIYRLLNDEQFEDMYTRLFKQNGIVLTGSSKTRHPLNAFDLSKASKQLNAWEVYFEGFIENLDLFEHAWHNGVGRTKTYGFGKLRVETI